MQYFLLHACRAEELTWGHEVNRVLALLSVESPHVGFKRGRRRR